MLNSWMDRHAEEKYIALWEAVIKQAVADMNNDYGNKQYARIYKHSTQQRATHWLTHHSRDLHTVCDLANIHPENLIAYAKREATRTAQKKAAARARQRPPAVLEGNQYRLTFMRHDEVVMESEYAG